MSNLERLILDKEDVIDNVYGWLSDEMEYFEELCTNMLNFYKLGIEENLLMVTVETIFIELMKKKTEVAK